jgi:type II restriction enzyme
MRNGIVRINAEHKDLLSNDLGAIGGLRFEIGTARTWLPK